MKTDKDEKKPTHRALTSQTSMTNPARRPDPKRSPLLVRTRGYEGPPSKKRSRVTWRKKRTTRGTCNRGGDNRLEVLHRVSRRVRKRGDHHSRPPAEKGGMILTCSGMKRGKNSKTARCKRRRHNFKGLEFMGTLGNYHAEGGTGTGARRS